MKYVWIAVSCLSLVSSCTSTSRRSERLPNILLIVSEDHGQDLGCYGNQVVYTPTLDSLAENGVKFINAYTTYSVCSPSRASIFTGLYPHENGQIGLATHGFRMYKHFDNIPGYLKTKGYRTGCLGKIHVNPESALPFDFQEITKSNFAKKELELYAKKALEFFRSSEDPFFLMVNYPDAHFPLIREVEGLPTKVVTGGEVPGTLPFVGADTERLRDITADYYSQVNRMDECVSMLLDSLKVSGKSDHTLIIYLSDHGAQFSRGKTTNYEAGLKIPMIMHWPGHIPGDKTIEKELVSVIDIFPTIIDATGSEIKESLPGKSVFELVREKKRDEKWRDYVFAEGHMGTAKYFYPKFSVRGKRFKLIHNLYSGEPDPYFTVYTDHIYPEVISGTNRGEIQMLEKEMQKVYDIWENPPEFELYDLKNDPWEFKNLADDQNYQKELNLLKNVLNTWRISTRDPFMDAAMRSRIRKEVDSINIKYPDHSYQKDPGFKWRYPEYFGKYVLANE